MDKQRPLMKCGHAANATDTNGNPVCVICITPGKKDDPAIVVIELPSLEERKAICAYCSEPIDSNIDLAFFEYRPDKKYDSYYCGCEDGTNITFDM